MATMDDSASDLFSDRRLLRELADLRFNAQRVAVKRIPRQDVTLGGGGRGGAARKAPPRVDAPTNERPAISLFDVLDDEGEPPKGFLGRLWGAVKPVRADDDEPVVTKIKLGAGKKPARRRRILMEPGKGMSGGRSRR